MKRKIFKHPVIGGIFFVLFIATVIYTKNRFEGILSHISQLVVILEAGLALYFTFNFKKTYKETGKNFKKTSILSIGVFAVIIPLTILAGMHFFGDRGYYLLSIIVVLEALVPFFVFYEKKKANIRQLVVISIICAFAVIGRVIFFALPQFKPTAAIIMIAGVCFGGETGFLCGALAAFLSNIYYGQGVWTLWQMLSMGMMGALSGLVTGMGWVKKDKISLSLLGAFLVFVVYGFIMNTSGVIAFNDYPTAQMFAAAYIAGVPFDLIHAASTAFFMWFLAEPLEEKMDRIILKYNL